MSVWDVAFLELLFLALTAFTATLALRSVWKHRHEPPLTPLRIVVTLLIIGGGLLPVVLRASPDLLLVIAALVFLASVGWLIIGGL